jgi:3-isopropylmalate dehydrogenase
MSPHKILVLPGDHVGPEIIAGAIKTLQVLEKLIDIKLEFEYALCGGCSIDKHWVPITPEVVARAKAKASDAVLFGSVGGSEWYA